MFLEDAYMHDRGAELMQAEFLHLRITKSKKILDPIYDPYII